MQVIMTAHKKSRKENRFSGICLHIKPSFPLAHKLAVLMQPHSAPGDTVTGDKLHFGVVGAEQAVAAHFQTQPARFRLEIEQAGARAGVPGGQQVIAPLQHKGAVARTHQVLGIWRWGAAEMVQIAPAAFGQRQRFAALLVRCWR